MQLVRHLPIDRSNFLQKKASDLFAKGFTFSFMLVNPEYISTFIGESMHPSLSSTEQRRRCLAAIEWRVKDLARRSDLPVSRCSWSIGSTAPARPHRLDVILKHATISIYFCDHELMAYLDESNHYGTEARLRKLMQELRAEQLRLPFLLPLKRLNSHVRP